MCLHVFKQLSHVLQKIAANLRLGWESKMTRESPEVRSDKRKPREKKKENREKKREKERNREKKR